MKFGMGSGTGLGMGLSRRRIQMMTTRNEKQEQPEKPISNLNIYESAYLFSTQTITFSYIISRLYPGGDRFEPILNICSNQFCRNTNNIIQHNPRAMQLP